MSFQVPSLMDAFTYVRDAFTFACNTVYNSVVASVVSQELSSKIHMLPDDQIGTDSPIGTEKTRAFSRFILNNPSLETRDLVHTLFSRLGVIVKKYNLTAEDFNYLLEAFPEARSAFSWRHCPDSVTRLKKLAEFVEKLKNFDTRFTDIDAHFAQYVSEIENITSAIGYRAINLNPSRKPTTPLSDNLKQMLQDVQADYHLDHISTKQFPHRKSDDDSRNTTPTPGRIEIPAGEQDAVEGGLPGPQKFNSARQFTPKSYVARALSHNIPMRAHVSATAALTLSGMEFILNEGRKRTTLDQNVLIKLSGLICASYEIGDFHSYAETAAGVAHFYQAYVDSMYFPTEDTGILEDIHPKTFYALSFGFLNSIVSNRAMEEFTAKSQELLDLYTE